MTVYNAEQYLKKSIQSIINQTYKNWELIIIDDCSRDGSIAILNSFKNKKIKIFMLPKHLGRTKALNYGLDRSKGKYIAIMDADDYSEKNRLETQVKFLENNKDYSLVTSWYKLIFSNKIKVFERPTWKNKFVRKFLLKNILAHSSIMYLRSSAFKFGKYPQVLKYAQDWGLILRFIKWSNIKILKKYLVNINVSKDGMTYSNKYKLFIIKDYIKNLNYIQKNFKLTNIEFIILKIIKLKYKLRYKLSKFFI